MKERGLIKKEGQEGARDALDDHIDELERKLGLRKGGGSRRHVEKLALRRGSHGQGKRLQRHGARKIVRSSFFFFAICWRNFFVFFF